MQQISIRLGNNYFSDASITENGMLENSLFQNLKKDEVQIFQQDGAVLPFSNFIRNVVNENFQPSGSPDLTSLDVILCLYIQSAVTSFNLSLQKSGERCFISTTTVHVHGTGTREIFSIYTQIDFLLFTINLYKEENTWLGVLITFKMDIHYYVRII
jgi:hypothetical protein